MDQERSASSVIASSSDPGIDVMAISVSSVTCPNSKRFRADVESAGRDECYLPGRSANHRTCFSEEKIKDDSQLFQSVLD